MKILTELALAMTLLITAISARADWVSGHFGSNGTYVAPYYRSSYGSPGGSPRSSYAQAERMYQALTSPDSPSPDLGEWMAKRYVAKKERKAVRKKEQEHFQSFAPRDLLRPTNMIAFVQNGIGFVEMILNNPDWKQLALEAYLGQRMKHWHSDADSRIDEALAGLNYRSLLKLPFTRSYLLTEVLYDLAPITKVGDSNSEASNPQVLSGDQINNEEDQEYVVAALNCKRLLTCDRGMHRIADAIQQAGYWKGRSILFPPDQVHDLGRFLS